MTARFHVPRELAFNFICSARENVELPVIARIRAVDAIVVAVCGVIKNNGVSCEGHGLSFESDTCLPAGRYARAVSSVLILNIFTGSSPRNAWSGIVMLWLYFPHLYQQHSRPRYLLFSLRARAPPLSVVPDTFQSSS